jgi:hypothetical protein
MMAMPTSLDTLIKAEPQAGIASASKCFFWRIQLEENLLATFVFLMQH